MYKDNKNLVVIDVGDSKIAAICANIYNDSIELLHCAVYAPEGFDGGVVSDIEAASTNITKIIYNIEKDSQNTIRNASIAISPHCLKSYFITITKTVNNQVDTSLIEQIYNAALNKVFFSDKEILHYFPIEFLLDESYAVDNPIGLSAKSLSCKIHILTTSKSFIRNIVKCFAKANIEITEFILTSLALGKNLKNKYPKSNFLILDIGSKYTSLTVFHKNYPIYVDHVALGGKDISQNIASKFLLTMKSAEKIKILHGNAMFDKLTKNEILHIENFDHDLQRHNLTINSLELTETINYKIFEIIKNISSKYFALNMDNELNIEFISLCGGSAELVGIRQAVIECFSKPVKIIDSGIETKNITDKSSLIHVLNVTEFISRNMNNTSNNNLNLKRFFKWFTK